MFNAVDAMDVDNEKSFNNFIFGGSMFCGGRR